MPNALAKKYPNANKSLAWQYIFPSYKLSADPETGEFRRHHFHQTGIRKAIKKAVGAAHLTKPITPHTLRYPFTTKWCMKSVD